jgi:hypothetical protein
MSIRATRVARLLMAVALALLGLTVYAQAAHAGYGGDTSHQPAIAIDKTGKATATAGDLLTYSLAVSNPGNVPFAAAKVVVTDVRCDAPPALQSKNDDATPGTLDPGDSWTYSCRVQTHSGDTSVVNTAKVEATDSCGKTVTADETFTTKLTPPPPPITPPTTPTTPGPTATPQQPATTTEQPAPVGTAPVAQKPAIAVSPVRASPGSAKLSGPSRCLRAGVTHATVTGKRIVKVTFFVDGKRVKTLTKPNATGGRFILAVNVRELPFGSHRVEAQIRFAASSATKAKTLRTGVTRCAGAAVRPQFTG